MLIIESTCMTTLGMTMMMIEMSRQLVVDWFMSLSSVYLQMYTNQPLYFALHFEQIKSLVITLYIDQLLDFSHVRNIYNRYQEMVEWCI